MTSTTPLEFAPDLLVRFTQPDPRTDDADTTIWNERITSTDYRTALATIGDHPQETLGLYLHIPFCPGRCLYCGCNTTVTHNTTRIDRYLDALEQEIEQVASVIAGERDVLQLHVAGGTPNYLNDHQLTRLVEIIERRFRILPETATAIECDPRRSSAGQLELLHALGFRQITFGVQDLEARVQRAIGRIQSIDLVRDVYWMARESGFDSVGFDLIYGLPEQTAESFEATLAAVVDMAPDRVACFGYARAPQQRAHQHAIDIHCLPDARQRSAMFKRAVTAFTQCGYTWIGLDTFALDTDELAIAQDEGRLYRNCIGYTAANPRHTIGFGAGAVGEINGHCLQNETHIERWQQRIAAGELPVVRGHHLSKTEQRRRHALSHMICNLELSRSQAQGCLDQEYQRLASYAADGLVEVEPDRLRITPTGRFFLRELWSEHDAYFAWDRARWHLSRSN